MLKDTGERVIPDIMKPSNRMLLEHLARYYFSIPLLEGRVLDIACGSGYGTQLMAKEAKATITEIVGVDIDQETITYARGRYYHPKIEYLHGDATDLSLPTKLGSFNTIVSFETLEHLDNEEHFLKNVYELLTPGGTLILSTPFGRGRGVPSKQPFHVHQLTILEFQSLFRNYPFKQIDYYYQKGVLIEPFREGVRYPFGIMVCTK